jgi:hypothetical protein
MEDFRAQRTVGETGWRSGRRRSSQVTCFSSPDRGMAHQDRALLREDACLYVRRHLGWIKTSQMN